MKKEIGVIGVDSGQVLICDPCYIDSQWKNEEFTDIRRYKHKDGTILQYGVDFPRFDAVIPKYGKSMNEIVDANEAEKLPQIEAESNFSYNACCKKTLSDDEDGQLYYEAGHSGVGVVSNTGYGDGLYPVIADIDNKTGRVKSITIVFIEDEDDDYPKNSWGF